MLKNRLSPIVQRIKKAAKGKTEQLVDNMEKKDEISEAVTRISGVTLNSFTRYCLTDHFTVSFCSSNLVEEGPPFARLKPNYRYMSINQCVPFAYD